MSFIPPNTELYLIKCPIEADNNNQLTFANQNAQLAYFSSLQNKHVDKYTFQRKDGTIRFEVNQEELLEYNYVMYKNDDYENKWIFAFVRNTRWINNKVVELAIETDAWQTWQFDITFRQCFVEREHVNDDTFGLHTVPEGLETGDFVVNGAPIRESLTNAENPGGGATFIVFQVTTTRLEKGDNTYTFPSATVPVFNGIPQGCPVFAVPMTDAGVARMYSVCSIYDSFGRGDAIIAISLVPYNVCTWETAQDSQGNSFFVPVGSWNAKTTTLSPITRNGNIDGYVPKNNKLFTGEFNYLYLSNNVGGDVVFNWENFNGNPQFVLKSALDQGGSFKIVPTNSKVSGSDGWTEGLNGGKLPCISWISDYYLNWKAVNGANVKIQAGYKAFNFGVGLLSSVIGGGGGNVGAIDFAADIANVMQQVKSAQMTPPQAKGNVSSGDINLSAGETGFTFRKMSIRAEFARQVDEYFSMLGYKVNRVKIPNINGRRNWNFVKTKQANIIGDIPTSDMANLRAMFDHGVTLWHNVNTFMDYSQDNSII
jgi:hypothetical protein